MTEVAIFGKRTIIHFERLREHCIIFNAMRVNLIEKGQR